MITLSLLGRHPGVTQLARTHLPLPKLPLRLSFGFPPRASAQSHLLALPSTAFCLSGRGNPDTERPHDFTELTVDRCVLASG